MNHPHLNFGLAEATLETAPLVALSHLKKASTGANFNKTTLFKLSLKLLPFCEANPDGGTTLLTLSRLIQRALFPSLVVSEKEKNGLYRVVLRLARAGWKTESLDFFEECLANASLPLNLEHLRYLKPSFGSEAVANFLIRYGIDLSRANEEQAQFLLGLFLELTASKNPYTVALAKDLGNKLPIRAYPQLFKEPLRQLRQYIHAKSSQFLISQHAHELIALQHYLESDQEPETLKEVLPSFLRRLKTHQPEEKALFLELFFM